MSIDQGVRAALTAVAALLLLGACGGGASAPPAPTPAPSGAPVPSPGGGLPAPEGSATAQVLLRNADGAYDAYRGIGRLDGLGSTCTFVLLETATGAAAAEAPAYILSNGHCVGLFDSTTVVIGAPADGGTATFDFFVDAGDRPVVATRRIAWATMRAVDLAVIELDATLGELVGRGFRPWPIAPPPATGTPLVVVGAPVGVPIVVIPEEERFLRAGTCDAGAGDLRVAEWLWLWRGMIANTCPEILPGNSGSPVLDRAAGALVGLINTTTYGSEGGEDCWQGRPCEVGASGEVAAPNTSYAVPLDTLPACFDAAGRFALGGSCALDDGSNVALAGTPDVTNPTIDDPLSGRPNPSTFQTTVAAAPGTGQAYYRYKQGPLTTTDCADEAGYGDVRAIATDPLIDDPLPTTEGRVVLCVIGGPTATPDPTWQAPANASFAIVHVDTVAPSQPVEFAVSGSAAEGWAIEPIFRPPTYAAFDVKHGLAASTDCADPAGYEPYRRFPAFIEGAAAPVRYCAIGYDAGGNRGPTGETVLE